MFIFSADNHVNLRGLRPEIPMEDTLQPLQEIVSLCIARRCPLVLGGDLYDTNNPPARLVARVNDILAQMKTAGLEVWAIQGNHDKDPETPWSTIAPGVKWLNGVTANIGGFKVYGIDFAPASIVGPRISQMPACDIVVIHQALRQGLGFDGAWNCDLDWFDPKKVKNVLAGDLHKVYQTLHSTDHQVRGWYPGTPYMTTIDENPHPSCFLVETMGSDGFITATRLPLKHRPFLEIDADTEAAFLDGIKDLDLNAKPIVVLRYPSDAVGVLAAAKKILKNAFLIESPMAPKASFSTTRNLIVEAREGLTLPKLINERVKDEKAKSFLLELVTSRDRESAQGVINSHRAAVFALKP